MPKGLDFYEMLISPRDGQPLRPDANGRHLVSLDGLRRFAIINGIVCFLEVLDRFYEGAYKNRVFYLPKRRSKIFKLPFWVINGGFVWQVDRHFPENAILLELGCASGIDFLGNKYRMIGLDLSLSSLQGIDNYWGRIQADASSLPLASQSVDGIISSYFWEHIPPNEKETMLSEFARVLKPGGKMIFIYDVQTNNSLIRQLKSTNCSMYEMLFIANDGHKGYESIAENERAFQKSGFRILTRCALERTWLQSASVWEKFSHLSGILGLCGKFVSRLTKMKYVNYAYILMIRLVDSSIGLILPASKARIVLTVLEKA